ncbi:MAG: hypothetical protein AAF939_16990, partial [Planctomycetota bacterium]
AEFSQFYESKQFADAVKALNRVKSIGQPGKIESFAASMVSINRAAEQIFSDVSDKLDSHLESVQSESEEDQVDGLLSAFRLKREFGGLKILRDQFSDFNRSVSKIRYLKDLVRETRTIDSASAAKSTSSIKRAIEKLNSLSESSKSDVIRSRAKESVEKLEAKIRKDS